MNNEISSISETLREVFYGEPWYGRAVFPVLNEIHPADVYHKPKEEGHSLIELLYHMIARTEFTLMLLEGGREEDPATTESLNWRMIDPLEHTWGQGVDLIKALHDSILTLLESKEDGFLDKKAGGHSYNFRFLLNGLIHHDIYHTGQIAYIKKWLIED